MHRKLPAVFRQPPIAFEIFSELLAALQCGKRAVLSTIVGLTGTGARWIGSPMVVLEDGSSWGSLSSGCVETAIVAEALSVLVEGRTRTVRFGQGSDYIDIRLPCGGGMDVMFIPDPETEVIDRIVREMEARHRVDLCIEEEGGLSVGSNAPESSNAHQLHYMPALKLIAIGQGSEMIAVLNLAAAYGARIEVYSPDETIVAAANNAGAVAERLISPAQFKMPQVDPWTAFLFLFHDHDWEPALLALSLETSAFWIGAMGSRTAQLQRLKALKAIGVPEILCSRVHGPVGLIPSARDPSTLALSALAEIVGAYHSIER